MKKQWTAPTAADMPSRHGFKLEDDLHHIVDKLLPDQDVIIIVRSSLGKPTTSAMTMTDPAAINLAMEFIRERVRSMQHKLDQAKKEADNLWHQQNPDLMGR